MLHYIGISRYSLNQGVKMVKEGIKRIHNRQYYDHFWYFQQNPESMKPTIQSEQSQFNQFFNHPDVKQIYDQYVHVSSQRKDSRHQDLPEEYDDYLYTGQFSFFDTGNDYQIIQRTKDGQTQNILDLKLIPFLNQYHSTLKMIKMVMSDDHNLLAFGIDLENDENQLWMIKQADENSPTLYREKLYDCSNAKFTKDGSHLLYVQQDDKFRPSRIMLHKLGNRQDKDLVLFEEKDEQYYIDIQVTKDKKYFVILSSSKSGNELSIIDREQQIDHKNIPKIQTLYSRKQQAVAFCSHSKDKFYILTNKDVYDYKLQTLQDEHLTKSNPEQHLQDYFLPDQGEVLSEIDIFENQIVLYLKKEGDTYLKVINQDDSKSSYVIQIPSNLVYYDGVPPRKNIFQYLFQKYIKQDDTYLFKQIANKDEQLVSMITPGLNENYATKKFRFHLDTPLVYNQVYEFDFESKVLTKLQDAKLTGKEFRRDRYTCSRIYAPSKDGTNIPITLVHNKTMKKNRQNKMILHAYGSYGISQDVPFNIVYLQALERGWVLAYAHVRGGNEKGQAWHKSAIKENKIKTIEDIQACAAHLIASGYTHPALLCGLGASAGATVFAAAMNMRPDLWKCMILSAPFLDVLNSLMDKSLPLTVSDHEEFGNPLDNESIYQAILSYSPYENIGEQVYPVTYIQCGQNDFRSPLWNVLKYVIRFRNTVKESEKVENCLDKGLLVEIQEGGHYGNAGVLKQNDINFQIQSGIEERARQLAFLEYFVDKGNKEIRLENITEDLDQSLVLDEKFEEEQKQKKQ